MGNVAGHGKSLRKVSELLYESNFRNINQHDLTFMAVEIN